MVEEHYRLDLRNLVLVMLAEAKEKNIVSDLTKVKKNSLKPHLSITQMGNLLLKLLSI